MSDVERLRELISEQELIIKEARRLLAHFKKRLKELTTKRDVSR